MSEPEALDMGDIANNFNDNPMVRRHSKGPDGKTCRTCKHTVATNYGTKRNYWKCRRRGLTHGAGTDHRLKWDACRLYEEL